MLNLVSELLWYLSFVIACLKSICVDSNLFGFELDCRVRIRIILVLLSFYIICLVWKLEILSSFLRLGFEFGLIFSLGLGIACLVASYNVFALVLLVENKIIWVLVGPHVGWSTCLWTMRLVLIHQGFEFVQFQGWLQLTILLMGILCGLYLLKIWQKLVMRGRTCIWLPMIGGCLSKIQRW